MSEHRLTRQELYDAIWSSTAARVAKQYSITFAALVRTCREFNIPRPGTDYWPAIRLGRPSTKTPLPPTPSGLTDTIFIGSPQKHSVQAGSAGTRQAADADSKGPDPDPPSEQRGVLADFKRCHPLVRSTWEHFKRNNYKDPQGRLETHARFKCLDVTVTKAQMRRALSIFQHIIEACEKKGWTVYKPDRDYYKKIAETLVVIEKEEVNIAMIEPAVKRPVTEPEKQAATESWMAPRTFFNATGLLRVGIGHMRFDGSNVIEETKENPLENRIPEIIEALKREAQRRREDHARYQEQARVRAEEERVRMLAEQQRELEAQRQRDLEQLAARWQASERVRNLALAVEKRLASAPNPNPAAIRWLAWARIYADKIDPVQNGTVEKSINNLPPA